jgi:hypothetical protein
MQFIASLSHERDVDVVKEKQGRERKKMRIIDVTANAN